MFRYSMTRKSSIETNLQTLALETPLVSYHNQAYPVRTFNLLQITHEEDMCILTS